MTKIKLHNDVVSQMEKDSSVFEGNVKHKKTGFKIFNADTHDAHAVSVMVEAVKNQMEVSMSTPQAKGLVSDLNKIKLSELPSEAVGRSFSELNELTTAISGTIFNQVQTMANDNDAIMARVRGEFHDAQNVKMNIRDVQTGLADGGMFLGSVAPVKTTGRTLVEYGTGFWGSKVVLTPEEMTLFRATDSLGGTYASEAQRRAVSKVAIQMNQRQRLVVARTITDNEYTYYEDSTGTRDSILQYGRLDSSVYTPVAGQEWLTINSSTGEVTNGTGAKPLEYLIDLFTDENNTIIRNTMPFLKGLLMNPITARQLTLDAYNDKNPIDATSFMTAFKKGNYDADSFIKSNVPALANTDIMIYDGMVNLENDVLNAPQGTDGAGYGIVTKKEYIIPTGYIIPIIDYESTGMGSMLFTPEPRKEWLHGTGACPVGMMGVSDPRSCYMRVISSLQDPRAEQPYWFAEAGARYAFVNPIAASTSYVINVGVTV